MNRTSGSFGLAEPLHATPLRFSAAGWDPYEVWSTRVRSTKTGVNDGALALPEALDAKIGRPAVNAPPKVAASHGTAGYAGIRPALVLAFSLGLNRGLVGIFGFDAVATVFGVMTPAARAVYVLSGISAIYCAMAVVVIGKRVAADPVSERPE
jgi:hypothetical protein